MSNSFQDRARRFLRDNWAWVIVGAYFFAAFIFVCCRGEHIYVTVHDNMEDIMTRSYLVRQTGTLFAHGVNLPMLGGLDRDFFPSEFKLDTWLFQIFPPFVAYLAKMFLVVLLPTIGWPLMAQQMPAVFKLEKKTDINYLVLCGFLYGLMPKSPPFAIALATLPLLMALLSSIYYRPTWWKYLLLFVYPVISDFVYLGIFACGYIVLFLIGHAIIKRKLSKPLLGALFVLAAGYIVAEYRLFYLMLVERIPTIRSTLNFGDISFGQAIYETIRGFVKGHYHTGTLQFYFIVWICGAYFVWNNGRYILKKRYKDIITDPFNLLVVWAAFNAVVFGFQGYKPLQDLVAAILPPLRGWSYARALWFNPMLWVWMFSLALLRVLHAEREYAQQKQRKGILPGVSVLLVGAFAVILICDDVYNDIHLNLKNLLKEATHQEVVEPTWEEFYAEDQFEQIKSDIAYDGGWSIAFGLHPAVLHWNGIATLDGYQAYCPLAYREKFASLVRPFLERDKSFVWGGRSYVLSPDVVVIDVHNIKNAPSDLLIDPDVFREMGGKYVFSAVEISNADELGLSYLGQWENENSLYTIHAYKAED